MKEVYNPTEDRKTKKQKPPTAKPETVNRSKAKETKPAETPKPEPKPAKKPTEEQVLSVMQTLTQNGVIEITSTVLRDKLGLDKESGRDIVRRIMKKLEADGKVVISKKVFNGKRERYVYQLKESK